MRRRLLRLAADAVYLYCAVRGTLALVDGGVHWWVADWIERHPVDPAP